MTAITVHWKGPAGSGSVDVPASGFYPGRGLMPDVFAEGDLDRVCLLLANGEMDTTARKPAVANAPMVGQYAITVAGATKVKWTPVSIIFGCAETVRLGAPSSYQASREWRTFWTKDMPTDPAAIEHIRSRLEALSHAFDDTGFQNPEASATSENRCCQFAWTGTLAAALDIDHDEVRLAAQLFSDFQLRWRHLFFYDSAGKPLTAHEHPWWRVGPSGLDGQLKLTIDSPYRFEAVCQHLAPDRMAELAVGFNDFAGRMTFNAYIEAVLSRPEFRSTALPDDQRTVGYCMNLGALWALAGMATPARDAALLRVVDGWRAANGKAPITGEPYASIAPAKTGKWPHGYPSLVDWEVYAKANKLSLEGVEWLGQPLLPPLPGETCDHLIGWLEQQAVARGKPENAYTFGPAGLWQGHTIVWQTAVVLLALCFLRDVPHTAALVPDVGRLIQHAASCIVGPGMRAGGVGPTGTVLQPNPFYNSYHSRFPLRVMPGHGANSTSTWIPNALLSAVPSCGPALAAECLEAAEREWMLTTYPNPPRLDTTGFLPIKVFGIKS